MAWTTDKTDWVGVRSLLNLKIHDELGEAGIEVPLPQRDLHLRSISKDVAQELSTRAPGPAVVFLRRSSDKD
jgi:potassium efflux system protein